MPNEHRKKAVTADAGQQAPSDPCQQVLDNSIKMLRAHIKNAQALSELLKRIGISNKVKMNDDSIFQIKLRLAKYESIQEQIKMGNGEAYNPDELVKDIRSHAEKFQRLKSASAISYQIAKAIDLLMNNSDSDELKKKFIGSVLLNLSKKQKDIRQVFLERLKTLEFKKLEGFDMKEISGFMSEYLHEYTACKLHNKEIIVVPNTIKQLFDAHSEYTVILIVLYAYSLVNLEQKPIWQTLLTCLHKHIAADSSVYPNIPLQMIPLSRGTNNMNTHTKAIVLSQLKNSPPSDEEPEKRPGQTYNLREVIAKPPSRQQVRNSRLTTILNSLTLSNINAVVDKKQNTKLHRLMGDECIDLNTDDIAMLISRGANFCVQNSNGDNPLIVAAKIGNSPAIATLIKGLKDNARENIAIAMCNAINNERKRAIDYARQNGDKHLIDILLPFDKKSNVVNDGITPTTGSNHWPPSIRKQQERSNKKDPPSNAKKLKLTA